jgi:hypothetical protein
MLLSHIQSARLLLLLWLLLLLLLQEWFAASEHWLVPYATFCFLRDLFGTAEHWRWGVMAKPSKQLLADITSPQKEWHNSILCCYWLQYQLHRQLRQVGGGEHVLHCIRMLMRRQ